jgi:hypothetical protein
MTTENSSVSNAAPVDSQEVFQDRRMGTNRNSPGLERRQFSDGHANLSAAAAELGQAIDNYKFENRRRYISYEEMLTVIKSLGYRKD